MIKKILDLFALLMKRCFPGAELVKDRPWRHRQFSIRAKSDILHNQAHAQGHAANWRRSGNLAKVTDNKSTSLWKNLELLESQIRLELNDLQSAGKSENCEKNSVVHDVLNEIASRQERLDVMAQIRCSTKGF